MPIILFNKKTRNWFGDTEVIQFLASLILIKNG